MILKFRCLYCNHEFICDNFGMFLDVENIRCIICNDTNVIQVRENCDKRDVFGYNKDKPMEDSYIKKKNYE